MRTKAGLPNPSPRSMRPRKRDSYARRPGSALVGTGAVLGDEGGGGGGGPRKQANAATSGTRGRTGSADELKEPLATNSAMSWSKQHTTVRRCGDHNEHPLQHHTTRTALLRRKEHTRYSPTIRPPRNKSRWHIFGGAPRTDGAPRPGPGSCPPHASGGWLDTTRCRIARPEKKGASPRRNLVR
jgi:hypothetical protein